MSGATKSTGCCGGGGQSAGCGHGGSDHADHDHHDHPTQCGKKASACCGGAPKTEKPVEKKVAGCGSGCACAAAQTETGGGCCTEEVEVFDPSKPLSEKLKARLAEAVGTSPLMIFIKGTPQEPKCKFSKAVIRFLMENNVTKFGYFDILTDQTVREALKVYSNWKTYPQIYINSELIGGLDVVKELHADGQFLDKVPQSCFGKGLFPRIKKIIDSKQVIIFLKGTPTAPRDDDSKSAVELLRQAAPDFGYYDVTQEAAVENGLLQFAMQSKYPQVFAFGEHIGGLKELTTKQSEGKLKELLTKSPAATAAAAPAAAV